MKYYVAVLGEYESKYHRDIKATHSSSSVVDKCLLPQEEFKLRVKKA